MSKSWALLMAGVLTAAPFGVVLAQGTSAPSTLESRSAANMSGTDNTSRDKAKPGDMSAATNPNVPGATGKTIVPGSNSSIAGSSGVHPDPNAATTGAGGSGGGSK